jgi:hypothetical protein
VIFALIALGVAIVAMQVRYDIALSRLLAAHAQSEHEWSLERSELVTRAMHPQVVLPPRGMVPEAQEPAEPDEFHLVGRVLSEGDDA